MFHLIHGPLPGSWLWMAVVPGGSWPEEPLGPNCLFSVPHQACLAAPAGRRESCLSCVLCCPPPRTEGQTLLALSLRGCLSVQSYALAAEGTYFLLFHLQRKLVSSFSSSSVCSLVHSLSVNIHQAPTILQSPPATRY